MRLGIIGGGRAGWAFGHSLQRAGWVVEAVALRGESSSALPERLSAPRRGLDDEIDCDLLLVAVSDDALPSMAGGLRRHRFTWAFHSSGSLPASVLGDRAFSLHPLRSLPDVGAPVSLAEALLTFEGPAAASGSASQIVRAVGGRMATVTAESKPLYHAAAVFASNYVALLCDAASELMRRSGVDADLRSDIESLARSALENWRVGGVRGFTGPLVRGDRAVVAGHLHALEGEPNERALYLAAARSMLQRLADEMPDRPDFQEIARWLERVDVP
jgi:predicted short-subunit dehydrogenase-like oxidoreductase (DUF2520 family)